VVAASRQVSDGQGGYDTYTTSASFVLSRAYAQELFMGEWSPSILYERTTRTYPTVTYNGCKWYLAVSSSQNNEPYPTSTYWKMVYGVNDMEIRFYNAAGMRITSVAQYPGYVNLYLEPRLMCGNYDITDELSESDWSWERYSGNYGEETDTRTEAEKQADQGWVNSHWPSSSPTRIITLNNDDMPPTWGSGSLVNFIVTANYGDLVIENAVQM